MRPNPWQPSGLRARWTRYLPFGVLAILGGMALLALLGLGALTLLPVTKAEKTVTVVVNGQAQTTTTHASTVAGLLDEMHIPLLDGDTVSPALAGRLTQNLVVRVMKARSITLTVDGQSQIFRTNLTNPAAILESAGLVVGSHDIVVVDGTQTDPSQLEDWPVPVTRISLRRTQPNVRSKPPARQWVRRCSMLESRFTWPTRYRPT